MSSSYLWIPIVFLLPVGLCVSCISEQNEIERQARQEKITNVISSDSTIVHSALENTIKKTHKVESFDFKTTFSTGDYNLDTWRFTDSKEFNVSAEVENVPNGTSILINNVHIDIVLKSAYEELDENCTQYSQDHSYVGEQQDGFLITENYSYQNSFSINALNEDFLENLKLLSISKNSLDLYFYASKIQIQYDLLIKYDGEEFYHPVSVSDVFTIPVYDVFTIPVYTE